MCSVSVTSYCGCSGVAEVQRGSAEARPNKQVNELSLSQLGECQTVVSSEPPGRASKQANTLCTQFDAARLMEDWARGLVVCTTGLPKPVNNAVASCVEQHGGT